MWTERVWLGRQEPDPPKRALRSRFFVTTPSKVNVSRFTQFKSSVLWPGRPLGAAVALVLAAGASWFAFNAVDASPQPAPAALSLPADALAPADNAFWALVGLASPPGANPATEGLREWQRLSGLIQNPDDAALKAAGTDPSTALASPAGAPYVCPSQLRCHEYWFRHAAALSAQLSRHELLLGRCTQIAQTAAFEEPAATVSAMSHWGPHLGGHLRCTRVLDARGFASAAQGDVADAAKWFGLASQLNRRVFSASRAQASQNVAANALVRHIEVLQYASRISAPMAKVVLPLLDALPSAAFETRRWLAGEAAFERSGVDRLLLECSRSSAPPPPEAGKPGAQEAAPIANECPRIGFLPNQSKADLDALWTGYFTEVRSTAVEEMESVSALPIVTQNAWERWSWRNTAFRKNLPQLRVAVLVDIATQADVDLTLTAARLSVAMKAAELPVDERARWMASQPLRGSYKERMRLDTTGERVLLRTWRSDMRALTRADIDHFALSEPSLAVPLPLPLPPLPPLGGKRATP